MKTTKKKREMYTRVLAAVICGALILGIIIPVIFSI